MNENIVIMTAQQLNDLKNSWIAEMKNVVNSFMERETADKLLTAKEIKEKYNIGSVTLWRKATNEGLNVYKCGRVNKYKEEDILNCCLVN